MRPSLLGFSALASLALACSAPLATPATGGGDAFLHDAAEGASSAALVVLERTAGPDDTAHGSAVARFIRMRSGLVDDQTLRMVGATLDLPALGTCAAAAALDDALPASRSGEAEGPRAVELLDVGAFSVEAGSGKATLEARALPDIVDLVTGTLYSSRTAFDATATAGALPGKGAFVLRSGGAAGPEGVPAFSVPATAPGEPQDLRIEGQDAKAAEGVTLSAGARVELGWTVPEASDPDDVVYVDLVADGRAGGTTSGTIRCAFADRGTATLPAFAFGVGAREMTRGLMVVHRVHRETFRVDAASGRAGIEAGVVRFDFARTADFTRR